MMQTLTAMQFTHLWDSGVIRPGDVLLFDRRRCRGIDIVSPAIRTVQKRLLRDLGAPADDSWTYSHAAIAGGMATRNILEMTWPVCRVTPAETLPPGTRIKIRRPRHENEDVTSGMADEIVHAAWRDIARRRRYPLAELVSYWLWSWGVNKLLLGRRFSSIFTSPSADVCSGSVWRWCIEAGLYRDALPSDLRPEAWYPARLAVDEWRFRTVGVFRIREGK